MAALINSKRARSLKPALVQSPPLGMFVMGVLLTVFPFIAAGKTPLDTKIAILFFGGVGVLFLLVGAIMLLIKFIEKQDIALAIESPNVFQAIFK